MFNTNNNSNGLKLTLFSKCCNAQSDKNVVQYTKSPVLRLCSCSPGQESSMCHQAEKWLFHIPNSNSKIISQNYIKVIPSFSLLDTDEIAMVIHKHCRDKFSVLRKTKIQQNALERILRKIAGQLRLRKIQPYMQIYGWLGAQLLYHAGQATSHYILRHLIFSMKLYDQQTFHQQQLQVVQKMKKFIHQALQILSMYHIDVIQVIKYHSNSLFAQTIPQNFMGWVITQYLKNNWKTFIDIMCSFIDFRLDKNMAETRQQLSKMFYTGSAAEWPLIFCNMTMK